MCACARACATGISEGDAALGQVRRLRDILGGAFLDAEVVGVWGLRIFVKIYEKAPKRHPTSPERRPIEPKKRPKGPRRPPRENTGDPRGTEEKPKEGKSGIPRNWLCKSHDPEIPKSMKNLVKTVSFAYSKVLENTRKKIEAVKTIVFFRESGSHVTGTHAGAMRHARTPTPVHKIIGPRTECRKKTSDF